MICQVCGCSDEDPCIWYVPIGTGSEVKCCSWVSPELCSACAPPESEHAEPEALLFDAAGRPAVFR